MKDFKYERAQSFEDADKILKSNDNAVHGQVTEDQVPQQHREK